MSSLALLIGNKNYSSWSLRPWLALRQSGLEFDEVRIVLGSTDFADRVRPWSPAGKVPVLRHENVYVWESLAICEYLADSFPERTFWPRDAQRRALARAASAEMHSSFQSLRAQMPMNVRARGRKVLSTPELERDIARVFELWAECRARATGRGSFLFGDFTIPQSERYDLNITVRLQIVDPTGRVTATVNAGATRSRTVAADATLNDRERVWFDMTEQAMNDLNATLEKSIPLYLGAYLH